MPIKCFFDDEVRTCNECPFTDKELHCLYLMCLRASQINCPKCPNKLPVDSDKIKQCLWSEKPKKTPAPVEQRGS